MNHYIFHQHFSYKDFVAEEISFQEHHLIGCVKINLAPLPVCVASNFATPPN